MAQAQDIREALGAQTGPIVVPVPANVRLKRLTAEVLSLAFVLVSGFTMLLPLIWMVVSAFKEQWEITAIPAVWVPSIWRTDNFAYVLSQGVLLTGYKNSILVVPLITAIQVLGSIIGGYAFAKLRFPGRDILFVGVISTLILPGFLIQIPLFVMVAKMEWLNTYQALVVPFLFTPFGIFMMKQFMTTLPNDYIDAARIDGSGEIGIIWRVIIPLVKEAAAALSIFVFVFHWNELFWPLLVLRQRDLFTLPLALFTIQGDYGTYYHHVLAGATLAIIPVIIVYSVLQEHIIQGVTMTGLKG